MLKIPSTGRSCHSTTRTATAWLKRHSNPALRHKYRFGHGHLQNPNRATICAASHNAAAAAVAIEPYGLTPLASPSVATFFYNLTVIIEVALVQKTRCSASWRRSSNTNAKCSNGQSGQGQFVVHDRLSVSRVATMLIVARGTSETSLSLS